MNLPVIRSERLLLRPWNAGDTDALHALWTDPHVRRYLWGDIEISRDTAADVVRSHLSMVESHGIGYWAIYYPPPEDPAGAPMAGFCGFRFIDHGLDIELLYGLLPDSWGKGLATEASRTALQHLWRSTSFQQVFARTDPPNNKSVEVMKRLGMTHVSTTSSMITYVLERPERTLVP